MAAPLWMRAVMLVSWQSRTSESVPLAKAAIIGVVVRPEPTTVTGPAGAASSR